MLDLNKIYCGDNLTLIKQLDDNCIDLTVTSPPYDNLRTYNGFTWDFEGLAKELFRVTKVGGVVVWVVGDATVKGSETGTSFRQALHFMDCGFNLHDTMIYQKNNYVPLNHNRYDPEFEYMFIFSKNKPSKFNPLMQPCKTAGDTYNYATRSSATTKEVGSAMRKRDQAMITNAEKYRGNIWRYDTGKNKGSKDDIWKHPATFPEKLAEDHIISWSNPGDIVLDPFMGSGTTAKMALKNERQFIGFEISQEYVDICNARIKQWKDQGRLTEWF